MACSNGASASRPRWAISRRPADRRLEIRYERLIEHPVEVCRRLETFIGIRHEPAMVAFARAKLRRRSPPPDPVSPPLDAQPIAGELLARLGDLPTTGHARRHA